MRIDEIIAERNPTFSIEFFPPKTAEATEELFETARELRALEPDFVSVTYGAGGSTRDGTVEITSALKNEIGFETMAHLSCVGETTEGLAATLDRSQEAGIENVFALRGDPEREFELGVAYAAQQCAELLIAGAPGIHFYALNRAPATRAVLGALKASRPWERVREDAAATPFSK